MWERIVFDLETNDLLPNLECIHSLVLRDLKTDEMLSCTSQVEGSTCYPPIEQGLALLSKAERIYGHNILGFDIPAIEKLYPSWKYSGKAMDTLVVARMRWAHIKQQDYKLFARKKIPGNLIGSHSLEAWGYRLGFPKGSVAGFDKWTPEMQKYCEQDTLVTKALVERIQKSGVTAESVETEQELSLYLSQQEKNGIAFDLDKARKLLGVLSERREVLTKKLQEMIPPWEISLGYFTPKVNNKKRGYVKGVPVEKTKTVVFNPASTHHIADRLQVLYGWVPEEYTPTGLPKCDETSLRGIDNPAVVLIREYLTVNKRLGQLSEGKEGWFRHVTPEGFIHGRVKQSGTVTHRAAHWNPNLGQIPNAGSLYGPECRELFHAPHGWKQLGVDVSGLELRCLAHHMAKYDGGAYAETVLSEKPNDIHTKNMRVLQKLKDINRDTAKTWFYAWLYGSGDANLGAVLDPSLAPSQRQAVGKKSRAMFLKGFPALSALVADVKKAGKEKGYLNLLDGRRVYVGSEHAMLNYLLQGDGSVICKRWIVEFNRRLCEKYDTPPGGGWDHPWAAMLWVHDEVQLAVRPEEVETISKIVLDSLNSLTDHFKFRLPIDGEAKVGNNWKDCH